MFKSLYKPCGVRCLVVGKSWFAVHANGEIYALHRLHNRYWTGPRRIFGSKLKAGYISFLTGGRNGKREYVHRIVAKLFIPNPDNKRTINHIDGNKANNAVSNLEWATHQENHRHAFDHLGRVSGFKGKKWSAEAKAKSAETSRKKRLLKLGVL